MAKAALPAARKGYRKAKEVVKGPSAHASLRFDPPLDHGKKGLIKPGHADEGGCAAYAQGVREFRPAEAARQHDGTACAQRKEEANHQRINMMKRQWYKCPLRRAGKPGCG